MTALCGGGTSSPQVGFPGIVTFAATALAIELERLIPRDVADFLAPFIAGISVDLPNFCTTDPPTAPTITQSDFLALANFTNAAQQAAAVLKFQQWFLATYWCTVCKCDNGTIPNCTGSTLPTAPVGVSTGLPQAQGQGNCWNFSTTYTTIPPNTATDVDLSQYYLPTSVGVPVTIPAGSGFSGGPAYPIPAGATTITVTSGSSSSSTAGFEVILAQWDATNTLVGQNNVGFTTTNHAPITVTINVAPTSATWFVHNTSVTSGTVLTTTVQATTTINCSNQNPNVLQQPCCPPDPTTQLTLQNIYSLVNQIWQSLPTPLNSYADSTAHAGLVNAGQFALGSGTIGVRAHFQSLPASFGGNMGNPPLAYRAGRITASANTEPLQDFLIQFDQQVFALPRLTTEINYTLPVGVVLTLTELTRGP